MVPDSKSPALQRNSPSPQTGLCSTKCTEMALDWGLVKRLYWLISQSGKLLAETDLCSVNGEITQRYFSLSEWQRVLLAMGDQMHLQVATILSLSLQSQSKSEPKRIRMKKAFSSVSHLFQSIFAQPSEGWKEYKTTSKRTVLASAKILQQDV